MLINFYGVSIVDSCIVMNIVIAVRFATRSRGNFYEFVRSRRIGGIGIVDYLIAEAHHNVISRRLIVADHISSVIRSNIRHVKSATEEHHGQVGLHIALGGSVIERAVLHARCKRDSLALA